MKNILITGGAGFIGSNLALQLLQKGYTVTVLDNLLPQIHGDNPENTSPLYQSIKNKVQFIKGDVLHKKDWQQALKNQHIVVHFAAETGTGQSMYEIERYTNVNVSGTAILLDYLTNESHHIEKVIVASSRAVYGEGKYFSEKKQTYFYPLDRKEADLQNGIFELRNPEDDTEFLNVVATDEQSKIQPKSIYGLTKYHQEQALMICCSSLNIPCVAFRYQNVYGPGQSLSNPYTGILSIFSTRIKQHKSINIFEDGKESRDFVFIDDVIQATLLGIEKDAANFKTFNVGTGIATSVLDVAKTLMQNYEIEVPLEISGQYRKGDIRHNFADLKYIQSELGFNTTVAFKTGIRLFCNWVNEQAIQADKYEQSLTEMKAKGLLK
ncbi:MAG TPA: NAD-dependent epimerase/dehydratase family protein [Chitinophagales bacterium]|nr:NAD-dependent epimerase/dehydratase family protein [Chitinophagales bacterium]MBP6155115.1 NAD-dependent epimerase/dehydratase family protein [Chitinophagales bacterium]HQV77048.1 NAD-dependent epimerase/dehydratase family protein [Chitinophagales bacterium]HQW77885.1 NAD-dependent epimerase/dehydratase family protein [Chitinophagales bacterium]HRB66433.1 NAD-dependent epimerase/dehydratase family protein [Chitinophagales bacterium]